MSVFVGHRGHSAHVAYAASDKSLLDFVTTSPQHTILTQAVLKADLADTLGGLRGHTLVAPTDAAFDKLMHKLHLTAQELLNYKDLQMLLLYHVTPMRIDADNLEGSTADHTPCFHVTAAGETHPGWSHCSRHGASVITDALGNVVSIASITETDASRLPKAQRNTVIVANDVLLPHGL